jgi:hypothetical protein
VDTSPALPAFRRRLDRRDRREPRAGPSGGSENLDGEAGKLDQPGVVGQNHGAAAHDGGSQVQVK